MDTQLSYIICFVDDFDEAIRFYRDTLGFPLKFQSPDWTEFATGQTTLALHPASPRHPAGEFQLGLNVPDLDQFHQQMVEKGYHFTRPPELEFGSKTARFVDSHGTEYSVSGK
jgi:catechol 2,3-dioxygenase-like lactoylglutathione lyase family enzyme